MLRLAEGDKHIWDESGKEGRGRARLWLWVLSVLLRIRVARLFIQRD